MLFFPALPDGNISCWVFINIINKDTRSSLGEILAELGTCVLFAQAFHTSWSKTSLILFLKGSGKQAPVQLPTWKNPWPLGHLVCPSELSPTLMIPETMWKAWLLAKYQQWTSSSGQDHTRTKFSTRHSDGGVPGTAGCPGHADCGSLDTSPAPGGEPTCVHPSLRPWNRHHRMTHVSVLVWQCPLLLWLPFGWCILWPPDTSGKEEGSRRNQVMG